MSLCDTTSHALPVSVETKVIPGHHEPHTPAHLNQVGYNRYFPTARHPGAVLVLISGYVSGAGYFDPLARDLAARGDVEVWTINRREALLEESTAIGNDIKSFFTAQTAPEREAIIARLSRPDNYLPAGHRFLAHWGLDVQIADMKRVIERAKAQKRSVFLGGWSDGVEYVMAYTNTLFHGSRTGSSDLAGLVLLDENPEWGTVGRKLSAVDEALRRHTSLAEKGSHYISYVPSLALNRLAMELARRDPGGRSPLAGAFGLTDAMRRRGITNRALLGWLCDASITGHGTRSRSSFGWLVHAGDIASPSDQQTGMFDWKGHGETGENSSIGRFAAAAQFPGRVWEVFYPRGVLIDYWRIARCDFNCPKFGIRPNPENRLPVFYLLSGMNNCGSGVPEGLRWYLGKNGMAFRDVTLLRLYRYAHADIFFADRAREDVFTPLHEWLLRIRYAAPASRN